MKKALILCGALLVAVLALATSDNQIEFTAERIHFSSGVSKDENVE